MKHIKAIATLFSVMLICILFTLSSSAFIKGDVNGDGKIGTDDARLALRFSVNLETLTDEQQDAADVDGSDGVSSSDARLILRASVGLEILQEDHVHEFGAWQTERNSKRVATGKHYRVCSCGETEYADCSYGERIFDSITQPTCTKPANYVVKCSVCNGAKIGAIAALGHDLSGAEATCTTAKICPRCNMAVINALGHSMVAATCTDAAYCSRCNIQSGSALGHTPGAAATCTTDQTCIRCPYLYAEKFGHVFTVSGSVLPDIANAANGVVPKLTTGFFCTRCNDCTSDKLTTYNAIVNSLKGGYGNTGVYSDGKYVYNNTVTFIAKSTMTSSYNTLEFTTDRIGWDVTDEVEKSGLTDVLKGTTENYSAIYPGRVYKYTLPLSTSRDIISLLEDADVKSVDVSTVTSLNGNTILDGFADNYAIGSGDNAVTYDTTPYKNVNINEKLIKVTVNINDETYYGTNGVQNLAKDEKTALQKLNGLNIRDDAAEFGENGVMTETDKGEGYDVSMTMKLKQISSSGSVTFYFSAETLAPVAAVYKTNVKMSQDIDMSFKFIGIGITGVVDPSIVNENVSVYLFSGYFG